MKVSQSVSESQWCPSLLQVLSAVHKSLAKTHQLQEYPQRTMLHIDPNSFKLSSRLIDSSNFSGNGFPQDAKQVKNCTNFTVLKSFLPLQFLGHISDEVILTERMLR